MGKDRYILATSWDQTIPKVGEKEGEMEAKIGSAQTIINDLKDLHWMVDGVSLMKAAIPHIEQQRKESGSRRTFRQRTGQTQLRHVGRGKS